MRLGWICDPGFAALPSGRAQRGADLQLVVPLCAVLGSGPQRDSGGAHPQPIPSCQKRGL